MTLANSMPIAVQLSQEIDTYSDEDPVLARSFDARDLPLSGLTTEMFLPAVLAETDVLFSITEPRLSDGARSKMIEAASRAINRRGSDSRNAEQALEDLLVAINAVPDLDDEVRSLQRDAEEVDDIAKRRSAADDFARLLDEVASGRLEPQKANIDEFVNLINASDISAELAAEGVAGATEIAESHHHRPTAFVLGNGAMNDSRSAPRWADFLSSLRSALGLGD